MPATSTPETVTFTTSEPLQVPPRRVANALATLMASTMLVTIKVPRSRGISPGCLSSTLCISATTRLIPPTPSASVGSAPTLAGSSTSSTRVPRPISFTAVKVSARLMV